ncbi:Alpha-tocopherol transfer protein [Paragonimus skrjabini miyazakii]|uniref:Alpha-tocopherol transfer protein n=1 Tax=Paragonimus skrjabini miyazakii TaxID=59628 RepID=A0A8S9YDW1_9TREM|nr:Alpha-tocopherol transfer protein [Paragonimus skrjabini miyazakii]
MVGDGTPTDLMLTIDRQLIKDEQNLDAHLRSFRRWINCLPHITCPLDVHFLIPFLRDAKYNHALALKKLEAFCIFRSSCFFYASGPFNISAMDYYLKSGLLVELGRIQSGTTFLLLRLGQWTVANDQSKALLWRFFYMDFDRLMTDPWIQRNGYGIIHDMTGCSDKKHAVCKLTREISIPAVGYNPSVYPIRGVWSIYFNGPKRMSVLLPLLKVCSEEFGSVRTLLVRGEMDKAFNKIEGLKKIMPIEYNGENASIQELIVKHEQKLKTYFTERTNWIDIKVDENKRKYFEDSFQLQ